MFEEKFLRLISKQIKGLDKLMVKLYDILRVNGSDVNYLLLEIFRGYVHEK